MLRSLLPVVLGLTLCACGGAGRNNIDPVYPARPDAAYAKRLQPCARAQGVQRSCRLQDLPLLGMAHAQPQREDVMARVATSHPWMAERFETVLEQLPDTVLALSRSLSAIIIGADVRPSFYWSRTGAIYLDPALLWLSVDEKRSIDPSPDYRSGFGRALSFRVISRYVLNNQYAWYSYDLNDDSERELAEILAPVARLLFHELAHAGDFFPPDQLGNLDPAMTVSAAAARIGEQGLQIAQRLSTQQPLQSRLMHELAQVNFYGQEPTDAQLDLAVEDVTAAFAPDVANDDYNYSSPYEDVAMLFEELMLDYSYGIQRDVAVAERPEPGQPHIVHWGQRQRLAETAIRSRVDLVARGLLPEIDFSAYFAALGEPVALRSGASWNDNLDPQGGKSALKVDGEQRRDLDWLRLD